MKTRRSFRPRLEPVESRIALSFSLGSFLNSIFPGIDNPKPKAPAHVATTAHPAHPAPAHPAHPAPAHPAHPAASHPHAVAHPRATPAAHHPARG
jgi:hypothetical protein